MHDTDHRDMLGIGQVTTFAPYRDDNGWLVVSPGCEERRKRNGKSVVALSEVEIRLDSEDNRDTCLRHLDESDRRFSQIVSNPWDWQSVRTHGLTVRFAVEWYERDFFDARREAFQDHNHVAMYSDFGAALADITVEHFLVDGVGQRSPIL